MQVALVPLILLVASRHAHTSALFTGGNDICQGCVCSIVVKFQDSLLESDVPERALEEAQDAGSEHGAENGSGHGEEGSEHSEEHGSEHSEEHGEEHGSEHGAEPGREHGGEHGAGHSSGSAGAHSVQRWWDERWEKEHFDAWVIMVLVIITLFFDILHHKAKDLAGEAGKEHLDAHVHKEDHHHMRKIHTRSLWADLHNRCSSELAVLGFLACVVWTSNQIGVFEWIAEADYSDAAGIGLPLTAHDYLHHIEQVHMHLFITMCFYFIFMAIIILIATRLIRKSVDANYRIVSKARDKGDTEHSRAKPFRISLEIEGEEDKFIARFNVFREYYFISLERWRGQWNFFDEHMEYLREAIGKDARMFGQDAIDFQNMTMPDIMRNWFPFDLYIVVNYRHIVDEMIEVKFSTWLAIVAFLMIQASVKRAMRQNVPVTAVWAIVCQLVVVLIIIVNYVMYRKMYSTVQEGYKQTMPKFEFAHRLKPIRSATKVIQIACFFTIWELASTIATKGQWKMNPIQGVFYLLALVFGGAAEGVILGYALPIFSALVSCGPWMQRAHVLRFQTILKALERADDRVSANISARKLGRNIEQFDEQVEEDEDIRKEQQ